MVQPAMFIELGRVLKERIQTDVFELIYYIIKNAFIMWQEGNVAKIYFEFRRRKRFRIIKSCLCFVTISMKLWTFLSIFGLWFTLYNWLIWKTQITSTAFWSWKLKLKASLNHLFYVSIFFKHERKTQQKNQVWKHALRFSNRWPLVWSSITSTRWIFSSYSTEHDENVDRTLVMVVQNNG